MGASAAVAESPSLTDGLGPMQRLERAQQDPTFLETVWQRVIDGESLGAIAKSRGLPKAIFIRWITEEHLAEYDICLRAAADEDAHDLRSIADDSDPDEAAKTKLRIEVRRWTASRWDKNRYGEHTKVEHSGNVSLIALLSSLPSGGAVERIEEKVVPAFPMPAIDPI